MGQQMDDDLRELVKDIILDTSTTPEDVADCVRLVIEENVLSLKKVRAFGAEFRQVCKEALAERNARNARGAMPPTPPSSARSSAISPPSQPSSADPVPGTLQDDEVLRAAAASSMRNARGTVHLYRSSTRDFHFAFAKLADAEFSYITEKRLTQLGLPCNNRFIQIGWIGSNLPVDGDHTANETVFIPVSDEQASRVNLKEDILFGRRHDEDVEAQLQAVRASMNLQSAPSPGEIHPDESCAGSVAEKVARPVAGAAVLPAQAAKSPPQQLSGSCLFLGSDHAQQMANFWKAMASSGASPGPG